MSDLEQNFQPVRSFHTLQYRQIKRLSTGLSGTLKDSASPSRCVSANVTLTRTRPCFGTCSRGSVDRGGPRDERALAGSCTAMKSEAWERAQRRGVNPTRVRNATAHRLCRKLQSACEQAGPMSSSPQVHELNGRSAGSERAQPPAVADSTLANELEIDQKPLYNECTAFSAFRPRFMPYMYVNASA